jgi:hypothetical protein
MVNYVKTKNGYFYKICKNGKKRISEDEYNKQKKLKKMTGGMFRGYIRHPNEGKDVMENVFLTGDISPNGKTTSISRVSIELYKKLHTRTISERRNYNSEVDIIYVGKIEYNNSDDHGQFNGTSNIWIQHGYRSGKVIRYIVEIIKK